MKGDLKNRQLCTVCRRHKLTVEERPSLDGGRSSVVCCDDCYDEIVYEAPAIEEFDELPGEDED